MRKSLLHYSFYFLIGLSMYTMITQMFFLFQATLSLFRIFQFMPINWPQLVEEEFFFCGILKKELNWTALIWAHLYLHFFQKLFTFLDKTDFIRWLNSKERKY